MRLPQGAKSCCQNQAQGKLVVQKSKQLRASQKYKVYTKVHDFISFLRQLYRELEKAYDTRTEYEKDVWDFRNLGVRVSAACTEYKLNFRLIRQPWLRQLAKTCLRSRLAVYSAADCRNKLQALTVFSDFLAYQHSQAGPHQITRKLMVDYFGFLMARKLSPATRGNYRFSDKYFSFGLLNTKDLQVVFHGNII